MKKHWIVLFVLIVIAGTVFYLSTFTVEQVDVNGCEIVNTQTVTDAVKAQAPLDNTLLLCLKTKFIKLDEIPFVSKMDVEMTGRKSIAVTVY